MSGFSYRYDRGWWAPAATPGAAGHSGQGDHR